ncbi:MAG: pirin family protein [Gammaproteobacteria bacterium]|nr:pirin family protein [Gammaproteobacteria bacterium]
MQTLRAAQDRGHANHGWLDSQHTFSFGSYYDPQQLGFSNLRVINEDRVSPDMGFETHGHNDMEIISYVLDGALEHIDSMGNGSVIVSGDVQRMSAGTGVTHSEYNHSQTEPVHFLQIWLEPNQLGVEPGYEQKHFSAESRQGKMTLLVSPDGRDDSLSSYQDGFLYSAILNAGETVTHQLDTNRKAYIHVARGEADIDGCLVKTGDGLKIQLQESVSIKGKNSAEILLFDLP